MGKMKQKFSESLLYCYNCGKITEHAEINGHMMCLEDDCFEQNIKEELDKDKEVW